MINHNPTSRNRLSQRKTSYQAILQTGWVQCCAKLFSQSLVASESCQPQQTLACLADISFLVSGYKTQNIFVLTGSVFI